MKSFIKKMRNKINKKFKNKKIIYKIFRCLELNKLINKGKIIMIRIRIKTRIFGLLILKMIRSTCYNNSSSSSSSSNNNNNNIVRIRLNEIIILIIVTVLIIIIIIVLKKIMNRKKRKYNIKMKE